MKTKNIEFHLSLPKMIDVFPEPEPAYKNLSEWYKKMNSYLNDNKTPKNGVQALTVKKCQAILDSMMMGYVFKCPVDVYIDTTGENPIFEISGGFNFLSHPMTGSHAKEQYHQMPIDETLFVKELLRLNMIWLVKTQPGYSCMFTNINHSDESPLVTVPGVIDTDSFYNEGLFSFFVKKNYKGFIKKGTPLIQIIPFKRDVFTHTVVKNKDISEKLYKQQVMLRSVFNSGYKRFFWSKKRYE